MLVHVLQRALLCYKSSPALVNAAEGLELSYAELGEIIYQLANVLQGVMVECRAASSVSDTSRAPPPRIAVLSSNHSKDVCLMLCCALLGVPFCPINEGYKDEELLKMLDVLQPAVLFCAGPKTGARIAGWRAQLPASTRHVVSWEATPYPEITPLSRLLSSTSTCPLLPVFDESAIAWVLFTSGTTSAPKAAMLSHRNVMESLLNLQQLAPHARSATFRPQTSVAGCLQILHMVAYGGALIQTSVRDDIEFLRSAAQLRLTFMFLPGNVLTLLASMPPQQQRDLDFKTVAFAYYAGSKVPSSIVQAARKIMQVDFYQGYGLTETCGSITTLLPSDHLGEDSAAGPAGTTPLSSCGRPNLNVRIKAFNVSSNVELPAGVQGELRVKSPQVFVGYLSDAAKSREAVVDGWFCTGDLGYVDSNGLVYVVGRLKEVIITAGGDHLISASEVEDVLVRHPAVAEAAVVGVPIARGIGERIVAFVVLKHGRESTPQSELLAFCRQYLSEFKVPESIRSLPALPKSLHYQKVVKAKLVELAMSAASHL